MMKSLREAELRSNPAAIARLLRSPQRPRNDFAWVFASFLFAVSACFASDASESASRHFQQGLAYERLGRLEEAYTALQLAGNLSPDNARVALALGVVALRLGRDEVAQRTLEQSISIDANSVASYYELALLYEKLRLPDRAIDSWNRFIELSRDELLKTEARKHIQYLEGQRS